MQDLVTVKKVKRKKKVNWISVATFFVVLFLIIALIVTVPERQRDKNFEEVSYYFVYACKSPKENTLSSNKTLLKSLGGGGNIYFFRNQYYLLVNVYLSKEDADDVKEGIKSTFADAGVISIKSKEPSVKKIQTYKKQVEIFSFVQFLFKFTKEFSNEQLKYISGKTTDADFAQFVLARYMKMKEIKNNLSKAEKTGEVECVFNYINQCEFCFDEFFDVFFQSQKKKSLVCEFYINIIFCRVEMFDNL